MNGNTWDKIVIQMIILDINQTCSLFDNSEYKSTHIYEDGYDLRLFYHTLVAMC